MNPIDRTDIIDKYLQGGMCDDEKKEFERLLSDDSESLDGKQSLKEEMEEQKEIITAIKACGLKEQLKTKEVSIRKKKKITKALTISGGTVGGLFVVAALVMLLVVMPMSKTMVDVSNTYAQNINMDQVRGDDYTTNDDPQSKLARAYILMGDKQWSKADSISLELMDEAKHIEDEEMQEIYDQALWLHTMCIMHDGQLLESVKLLSQIAKSDSRYATQAQEILDDLL